ncbi:uncharacterized protein LOC128681058 [Plodia interpunctella]|uniref:uncharacterized protein LOC128681058 n=1 Tax=Plodia interpunctella TaxID=58824 RepID=UPI002367B40F|nr:uncharacterized protein LOC128681058 [Plodia interpunctella]
MDIDSLPLEAFLEILLNTDGVTLGRCRRVCKKWKEIIESNDVLWQDMCRNDYKYPSRIAKKKAGTDCKWYHIYKNMKMWAKVSSYDVKISEFYKFNHHDKKHALEIDNNILPLRDTNGVVLYDMSTLKYIPATVPERKCTKIANNDNVTVTLLKGDLFVQRTVENGTYMTEVVFKADDFILHGDTLFFYNNRDIYRCNLMIQNLFADLILHCDFDIKEIIYNDGVLHIFTDCGQIVNVTKDKQVSVQPIRCPPEWIKQIKYVSAINDKNFICYSRNLFKIETDNYQHLYLDFPPITALFFYGDVTLIGTKDGEILLYRLADQKRAVKPRFETLGTLPEGKFAVQLDVCERKTGPVIVASTFFSIILLEIDFFPHEKEIKSSYPASKMLMYKRLLKLRERLHDH